MDTKKGKDYRTDDEEKPEDIVDDIVDLLDKRHELLANSAQLTKYYIDKFLESKADWEYISSVPTSDEDLLLLKNSGIATLESYRKELSETQDIFSDQAKYNFGVVGSAASAVSTSRLLKNS